MKKIYFLTFIVLVFLSCNNSEKGEDKKPLNEVVTDHDFETSFEKMQGTEIDSSRIAKFTTIVGKDESTFIPELVTVSVANCSSLPTLISQLNSGSQYEYYKFTKERSAEASLMGFGGSIGKKEMLLIQDYVRWQDVDCNGEKKRIGIGLRCFIHVKGIKAGFKGSYADIAANAQLNNMTANFSLKSLGFAMTGDLIAEGLEGQNDYNVDNFGKLAVTFTNVLKTLKNNGSNLQISPVELPDK